MQRIVRLATCSFLVLLTPSCVSTQPLPPAAELIAPAPRHDAEGAYLCPYTRYGTVAEWVTKAKSAETASSVTGAIGQELGSRALGSIPIFGSLFGGAAGKAIGKEVALSAMGGWDAIKAASDQSFDRPEDLAIFVYAKHSQHADYPSAIEATFALYPEVSDRFAGAIHGAPRVIALADAGEERASE